MAYYIEPNGSQLRIDKGGNVFSNNKCQNPKSNALFSLKECTIAFMDLAKDCLKEGIAVQLTGHVPNFTYGRDENGDPIEVNTGKKSW